jgi:hypothetical protein
MNQLSLLPAAGPFQLSLRPRRRVVVDGRRVVVWLSDAVAYSLHLLKRAGKGGRRARPGSLYYGLADLAQASALAENIRKCHGAYVVVRPGKQLPSAFELVIHGDDLSLEKIAAVYGDRPGDFVDSEFRKRQAAAHLADCQDWEAMPDRALESPAVVAAAAGGDRPGLPVGLSFVWDRSNHCQVSGGGRLLGVIAKPKFSFRWSYKPTGGDWAGDFVDWRDAAIALGGASPNNSASTGYRVEMNPANPLHGEVFAGDVPIGEIWRSTDSAWSFSVPGVSPRWSTAGSKGNAIKRVTERHEGRRAGVSLV